MKVFTGRYTSSTGSCVREGSGFQFLLVRMTNRGQEAVAGGSGRIVLKWLRTASPVGVNQSGEGVEPALHRVVQKVQAER